MVTPGEAARRIPGAAEGKDETIHPEDRTLYFIACLVLLILTGFFASSRLTLTHRLNTLSTSLHNGAETLATEDPAFREVALLVTQLRLNAARYDYASALAMVRAQRTETGFLIGAVLALLGTVVVVRGVRDSPVDIEAETSRVWRLKLATSSPGIVLAVLGVAVVVTCLLIDPQVKVTESPLRLSSAGDGIAQSASQRENSAARAQKLLEEIDL